MVVVANAKVRRPKWSLHSRVPQEARWGQRIGSRKRIDERAKGGKFHTDRGNERVKFVKTRHLLVSQSIILPKFRGKTKTVL